MITKNLVEALREFSGEGIMSCKKALEACDGNLLLAAGWLATEGQLAYRPNDTPERRMQRAESHAQDCYMVHQGKLYSKVDLL